MAQSKYRKCEYVCKCNKQNQYAEVLRVVRMSVFVSMQCRDMQCCVLTLRQSGFLNSLLYTTKLNVSVSKPRPSMSSIVM